MKKTRLLALLLAFVFVFALLTACDTTPEEPVKSQGSEQTEDKPEISKYAGTDKKKFYFVAGQYIFPRTPRDYTEEELENASAVTYSVTEQAMADRVLGMEAKYGIELEAGDLTYWYVTDVADFGMQIASGDISVDMFHADITWGNDFYRGGLIAPISKLTKYIDPTDYDKWGSPALQMACSYMGELWGFPWHGSAYSPTPYMMNGNLILNNSVYDSYELDFTVQEMIEGGDWTFDKFYDLLPDISKPDFLNPRYGFIYNDFLPMAAVYANGGDKIVYNETLGKYVFGLSSQNAKNAIQWVSGIAEETDYAIMLTPISEFINGHGTIMMTNNNRVFGDVFPVMTEFQFIPFPYGPDAEYGTTYAAYLEDGDSCTGIINHPEDFDRSLASAMLFNELLEPLYVGENNEDYQSWLFRQMWGEDAEGETQNRFSYDNYCKLGLNLHWNYDIELGPVAGNINAALSSVVFSGQNIDMLDKLETVVNNRLDETMNP